MKAKLLGYTVFKEHIPANTSEWQDHDEGGTYWTLFFELENGTIMSSAVSATYGSCGSGYCGASWGNIEQLKVNTLPNSYNKAARNVFIEILPGNLLNPKFDSREEYYDAQVERLLSTEGVEIAMSTGNGGCQYYSSGIASINEELF